MSTYTTGDIAKLCNVSVRTVQYYDTRGILQPTELSEGGRRLYTEQDLEKMKIICALKELDLSLDLISKIMKEENSKEVINLILEEQQYCLESEIKEKQEKLNKLKNIQALAKHEDNFTVKSISDVANILENKKNLKRLHVNLLLLGLPLSILEWVAIILWITNGLWWLFVIYTIVVIPSAIFISKYYFSRVAYICPHCHEVFVPTKKEAFWANHTPKTRKLTCVKCGVKSFCVETYREEKK